jgi:hypothetical protein
MASHNLWESHGERKCICPVTTHDLHGSRYGLVGGTTHYLKSEWKVDGDSDNVIQGGKIIVVHSRLTWQNWNHSRSGCSEWWQ